MEESVARFLIDNDLSPRFALGLREHGFDAVHVQDYRLGAADDWDILQRASVEGRVVVSLDSDFSELAAASGISSPSIVHFRTSRKSQGHLLPLFLANLHQIQPDLARGAIVVIEDWRIRVRRLPIAPP